MTTGFVVPLVYSEFWGEPLSRNDTIALVARMHWRGVVKLAAGIVSIKWMQGVEEEKLQRDLVTELTGGLLYYPAIVEKLRDPVRRLFTRESLLAVLRMAVVEQSMEECEGSEIPDLFTRAILAVNEILSAELNPEAVTGTAKDLVASELRSRPLQLENLHEMLGRSWSFIEWAQGDEALRSDSRLALAEDFQRFTDMSFLEYAAGAYAVISRFADANTWRDIERKGVSFTIDGFVSEMVDSRVARQWIESHALSIEEARAEWRAEPSASAVTGSLWSRPLLRVGNDYVVPSVPMVANRVGDGMYYALMDGYRREAGENQSRRDAAVTRFTQFYGEYFEDYVRDSLVRGLRDRTDATIRGELEQPAGEKTSDVVVTEGDDVLIFEVVAKRMNFVKSIVALDAASIDTDLERAVVCKIHQLYRNVENFRNGVIFPEIPRVEGQRIYRSHTDPKAGSYLRTLANLCRLAEAWPHISELGKIVRLVPSGRLLKREGGFETMG